MKQLFFILLIFLFHSVCGQGSEGMSAAQIVDASLKFCGGEARLSKIKSSSIDYQLTQPDKSTAVIHEKTIAGKKYVQSILSFSHMPQTTFFDGEKLSRVNGDSVTHASDISLKEEIKLKTYNQVQYGYKMLGYELSRLEDKKFENFDCYVILARARNGYSTMNFFDKSNFRLLMIVYPNGNKSAMIDYTFKDSVLINSHIVNTFAGSKELQVLRLMDLSLNGEVSELWFHCPYADKVLIPRSIAEGSFNSSNGPKTTFERTGEAQDYYDEQGKPVMKRFLKWSGKDTYLLMDENAVKKGDFSQSDAILVRIVSWDNKGYVCQWITEKYTDTQDYKITDQGVKRKR